jgi:predicted nucleic acid-binding protein
VPVVDASVVVDWVAPDSDPALPAIKALNRLAKQHADLLAPRLLIEEVSNALLTGIRTRRWSGTAADKAHTLLRELPVQLIDEPHDLHRAWELARRYDNHPIYDLLYVALAERRQSLLITADKALRERLVGLDFLITPQAFAS